MTANRTPLLGRVMTCAGHRHHHGGAAERWAHLDEPDRDEWQRPEVGCRSALPRQFMVEGAERAATPPA